MQVRILIWCNNVYRYGTFIFDNERMRRAFALKKQSISIWTFINTNRDKFINPYFDEMTQHN